MEELVHLGRLDRVPAIRRNPLHHHFEALNLRAQLREVLLRGFLLGFH